MQIHDISQADRVAIRHLVARWKAGNPRVFGSALLPGHVARDLDILIDPMPDATLFDLGALQIALEDRLGVPVDLLTPGDLPPAFRARVLSEARPL